jgi:outer membrane protein
MGQAPAASTQTKVAVVNFQNAVLSTGEIQKALKDLSVKFKPRQDALQKGQQELSDIQTQLNVSQGKLSQAGEADLQARGQRKQTQMQRLNDDLQADFEADRDEAVRRASTRMQELLKKVAEEKGLDLIVDSAAAPFVKTGIDITDQVVAAYDKAYPAK